MKAFIDFIYTLLIGVAVLLFVSLGIWALQPGPKMPEYPDHPSYPAISTAENQAAYEKESEAAQKEYNKKFKSYEKVQDSYEQKIAGIALGAGVVFFVAGLWLMKRNENIAEGMALGGIFTAIYSAIRAGSGDSRVIVFASVTALLAMTIVLVFRRTHEPKKSR